MARIRTIKPDFFTDGTLGECSMSARYAFIGSWVFADDAGNFERNAKQFKAQVFPYDDTDAEELLVELIDNGLLIEYEVDGKKYLHIKGFDKHQKIDRTSKPRFPLYDDSLRTRRVFDEDSDGKGKERKGKEGSDSLRSSSPSLRSGSDQSSEQSMSVEDQKTLSRRYGVGTGDYPARSEVAAAEGKPFDEVMAVGDKPNNRTRAKPWPYGDAPMTAQAGEYARKKLPGADLAAMWEQFRDYALANRKTYHDWNAAWRTWVLNAPKFDRNLRSVSTKESVEAKIAASKEQLKGSILCALGSPIDDRSEKQLRINPDSQEPLGGSENGLADDFGSTTVLEGEVLPIFGDDDEPF